MGLPRPNFARLTERLSNIRVPERLRSIHVPGALSGRVSFSNGLSAAGGLTLPYKLAVVAVMMLVAGGTLVTFGSAGAETASVTGVDGSTTTTVAGSVLPGTSEATPRVEGQVLPETTYDFTPDTSILSADDLLASLKLTDYSTDADDKSDDDKSDDDDDKNKDDDKNDEKKKSDNSTKKPTNSSTSKPKPEKTQDADNNNGNNDSDDNNNGDSDDNDSDDNNDGDSDDEDQGNDDDRPACKRKVLRPKNCD